MKKYFIIVLWKALERRICNKKGGGSSLKTSRQSLRGLKSAIKDNNAI